MKDQMMTLVKFGIPAKMNFLIFFSISFSFFLCTVCADWPQFLGPNRNGANVNENIPLIFKNGEPEIGWTHKLGFGFAGPVTSNGIVYIFHREGNNAILDAISQDKGKKIWSFNYPTDYIDDFGFDKGPRAVPLIYDDKIYIYGAEGMLHALEAKTGDMIWKKNLRNDYGAEKGFFGRACSPMIAGKTLIVQAGGKDCGILGFDPVSGKLKWTITDHEAGYASPVKTIINDKEFALFFTRSGFLCIEPNKGNLIIEKENRSAMNASVNAASPTVIENDKVFLSACYGVGASLWKIDINKRKLQELWRSNDKLDCHYATPILYKGHLVGYHGRQETGTELRCVEVKTGRIKWKSDRLPAGTITLSKDTFIILSEKGELVLAPASISEFKPSARGQILGAETRAMPALSNGWFFARDKRKLVSVKFNP